MLEQKLTQKMMQKLSPQQIQLIKLLQVPTAQLDQKIQEEIESNPALEIADGSEASTEDSDDDLSVMDVFPLEEEPEAEGVDEEADYVEEGFDIDDEFIQTYVEEDPVAYRDYAEHWEDEEESKAPPIRVEKTFHEYLLEQLGMEDIKDEKKRIIAEHIIGNIDESGYLRRDVDSIADDILFSLGIKVEPEEVEEMLKVIQRFDPVGVGARDLRECLLIQLREKLRNQKNPSPALQLAHTIIDRYFNAFAKKHYNRLLKQLNIDEAQLKEAIDEILKLNPKPASGFIKSSSRDYAMYIVPDFIVTNNNGKLELSLNTRNMPELRINEKFKRLLEQYQDKKKRGNASKKDKETIMFVKSKIDSAKWFIDALKQRQKTLYKTMYAIMQSQKDYFLTGDESKIKPMILKDIAELTGLDISTISRVANSKYVQTEYGTKLLKDFFSESVVNQKGEEISTLEIKQIMKKLIDEEDKRNPLSDEKLREELQKRGYNIARRTIAKYRESLNIPVARLRKEIV